MSDLFDDKNISPMLLQQTQPFDSEEHIFELKLDGIRCLAYIDKNSVVLENKRFKDVSEIYPELQDMNKCVKKRCILDGELVVLTDGQPDFFALQKRSLMSDKLRIELASKKNPVQFVAYDILYIDHKDITSKTLMERKLYLQNNINEGHNLSISRYIETNGIEFFKLAKKQNLEGIVAKKKDGKYHIGKRTDDWVKIKVMQDEDLVVCGYMPDEEGNVKDVVLGYYDKGKFKCRGKVYLGVSKHDQRKIQAFAKNNQVTKAWLPEYKNIVWLQLELVGTVKYMHLTKTGGMRQPVWKGLRDDKSVEELR